MDPRPKRNVVIFTDLIPYLDALERQHAGVGKVERLLQVNVHSFIEWVPEG